MVFLYFPLCPHKTGRKKSQQPRLSRSRRPQESTWNDDNLTSLETSLPPESLSEAWKEPAAAGAWDVWKLCPPSSVLWFHYRDITFCSFFSRFLLDLCNQMLPELPRVRRSMGTHSPADSVYCGLVQQLPVKPQDEAATGQGPINHTPSRFQNEVTFEITPLGWRGPGHRVTAPLLIALTRPPLEMGLLPLGRRGPARRLSVTSTDQPWGVFL